MKSFLTISQLKARIQQLNNLIGKFPTVRSLVRKWGFELVRLEGKVESLEARKQPETPKQLTIWDVKPMTIWQQIKKDFEAILLSVFADADKSKLSKKFDPQKCIESNWKIVSKNYEGRVFIEPSARALVVSHNIGGVKQEEIKKIAFRIDAYKSKAGWNPTFEDKEWHFGAADEESF